MKEEWKDVSPYVDVDPGRYKISNLGRICRLPYVDKINRQWGELITTGYIVTSGYKMYRFSDNQLLVHRVVAMAFCDGYKDGLQVNHIDKDRTNNSASNLEWCDAPTNVKHSLATLSKKDVLQIVNMWDEENLTVLKISRHFNSTVGIVRSIINGKSYVDWTGGPCKRKPKVLRKKQKG